MKCAYAFATPYGVSKLATEHYLYFYERSYGVRYIAMRYANVYGPRQDPHGEAGVVAIFIGQLLRGEQPVINGDGTQSRDLVYVGDVARASLLAIDSTYCGPLNTAGTELDCMLTCQGGYGYSVDNYCNYECALFGTVIQPATVNLLSCSGECNDCLPIGN